MCYICVVCCIITVHCNTWGTSGCYNCVYVIMVHYNTWGTSGCVTVVVFMSSWSTTTPGVLQDVLQLCLCHHGALQHLGYFKMCYNCVYVIMVHYNTCGTSRCVTIVFMSSWCTTTPVVLQDVLQLCVYVIVVHYKTWGTSRCVTVVLCVYVITVHCNTWGTSRCVTVVCLCHHGALQHPGVLQDVLQLCVYVIMVHCKTWGSSRCVTIVLCVYVITVHCNTWGTSRCVTVVCLCHHGALQHPGVLQDVLQLCVYVIMVHCKTWGTSRCVTIVLCVYVITVHCNTWGTSKCVTVVCLCHHGALQHPGVLQDVLQLCVYVIMVHCKTWGTSRCVTIVLCVYVIMVHCNTWGTSRCVTVVCLCHHGALQHLGYFKMCYSSVFMSLKCTTTPGVLQDVLQLCVYVTEVHCNTWGTSRCVTVVCLCHWSALQHLGYFKMCYSCVFMMQLQLCFVFLSCLSHWSDWGIVHLRLMTTVTVLSSMRDYKNKTLNGMLAVGVGLFIATLTLVMFFRWTFCAMRRFWEKTTHWSLSLWLGGEQKWVPPPPPPPHTHML